MSKICTKCKEEKPTELFVTDTRTTHGYSSRCLECKEKQDKENAASRQRTYRAGKGKNRKKEWLKALYGLTEEEFNKMKEAQNHACKICGTSEKEATKNTLFVDHCHQTGSVRGLLCHHCNTALGYFKDDAKLLQEAIRYLDENSSRLRNGLEAQ